MSVIKPRTRGKRLVKVGTGLDQENQETVYAYAAFLGESTEYVLNQLIDTVLAKDTDVGVWRAAHPQSCVPSPVRRRRHDVHPSARATAPRVESTGALSVS
jgi:hypothetical protein